MLMQPQEAPEPVTPEVSPTPGLIMPQTPETLVQEATDESPEAVPADVVEAPEQPTPGDGPESSESINPFSWQASEYIHHAKGASWYLILSVIVVILLAGAVLTKQWFAIPVFAVMFAAVAIYARKPPRTLTYVIDQHGITIEDKPYPFKQFRSFSINQDVAWHMIDLEPTQRFSPRQTIMFDEKDLEEITQRLSAELPREDRQPDAVERAARYLRF